jgi:hypothetical protein
MVRYSSNDKLARKNVIDYHMACIEVFDERSMLSEAVIVDDDNKKITLWSDMHDKWVDESYAFMVRVGYLRKFRIPTTCFRRMAMDDDKIFNMNRFADAGNKSGGGNPYCYPDFPSVNTLFDSILIQLLVTGNYPEDIFHVLMHLQTPFSHKWMQYLMRCIYVTTSLSLCCKTNGSSFFIV